jgi:hypothetical protein
MAERRQLRIATLTAEVSRRRRQLALSERTMQIVPSSRKEEFLGRIREIGDEPREMERELHDLRVQQIREELSNE